MSDLAIRVDGLSKRYFLKSTFNLSLGDAVAYKARDYATHLRRHLKHAARLRRYRRPEVTANEFWALRDVSFELRYGEVMGVIGENGAGKSTLLKILSRITQPTEGRADVFGRIGSLLEVGTGFNPDLTGRENIFLYGAILGMNRADIARRFDEIVAFAEIETFLDEPIKHYSTGMHSRLGFSVAAHLECDVLLVDEVLSVGDAAFREKCLGKMNDVTGQGRAVIFVSHSATAVNNMCQYGMVLKAGRVIFSGLAEEATATYLDGVKKKMATDAANPVLVEADDTLDAQFTSVRLSNEAGQATLHFDYTETPNLEFTIEVRAPSSDFVTSLLIEDLNGNNLIHTTDDGERKARLAALPAGRHAYIVLLPVRLFREGSYRLSLTIGRHPDQHVHKLERVLQFYVHDHHRTAALRSVAHRPNLIAPELGWDLHANRARGDAGFETTD